MFRNSSFELWKLNLPKSLHTQHPPKPESDQANTENKPKIETSFRGYGKLNPSLTFENFVIGKANQLAFAAATQVAELPGFHTTLCLFTVVWD